MATNPDFRKYVDLTIYDQQPGDIYSDAIFYGVTALPEFSLRPGTVEDALLQSMSFVAGNTIAAINRLPDGLMQGLLDLMGFSRIESELATGTVKFTVLDTNGLTIPAGIIVGYTEEVEGGTVLHLFRTLASATAQFGELETNAVAIEALEPGLKPPLIDGTQLTIFTNFTRLHQVFLDSDLIPGGEQENDEQYFGRAITYLASLSTGLVTTNQFDAYTAFNYKQAIRSKAYDLTRFYDAIPVSDPAMERSSNVVTAHIPPGSGIDALEVIRIHSADSQSFNGYFTVQSVNEVVVNSVALTELTWNQTGPDAIASDPGVLESLQRIKTDAEDEVGYVTVFVSGADGASLTPEEKTPISTGLSSKTVIGLQILVRDAVTVNVTANMLIKVLPGYDAVQVETAVDDYLQEMLSPNQWNWLPIIRRNMIIARASQVVGVDYVESFEFEIAVDEPLAEIEPLTGDVRFLYKGTLPITAIEISVL